MRSCFFPAVIYLFGGIPSHSFWSSRNQNRCLLLNTFLKSICPLYFLICLVSPPRCHLSPIKCVYLFLENDKISHVEILSSSSLISLYLLCVCSSLFLLSKAKHIFKSIQSLLDFLRNEIPTDRTFQLRLFKLLS